MCNKPAVQVDEAKAEVRVRFGSWSKSQETIRENFSEERMLLKESKGEGGKEEERVL